MVMEYKYLKNLHLTPYGGVDNVTKNMFVYEHGQDILVVDCGIGFPDEPNGEENLLIPDFTYLVANRDKIKGVVITHAHFDHYGAVPNLLSKINVPVFASQLTQEFIKNKAEEFGFKIKHIDFHQISPKDNQIKLGSFELTPFHINHSVPQALGLFLKTPIGNVFHVSDFKFDFTPVDEQPFDIQKASFLASLKQPLILLSDCLGAAKSGHTESETNIQEVFENLMIRVTGLVLVTTVSSNISRIKQAIQASVNVGRRVAFIGRSLEASGQIAQKLGYFSSLKNFIISQKKIKNYPPSKLTLIVAGSYGQHDSALVKISQNKHHVVKLKKSDVVIFSADPAPPGVIIEVNKMVDNLTKLGANVYYYEIQDNLHVSGHGTAEDIKMLISLVKPKYLLPIGGDHRHMFAYSLLAQKMGYSEKNILLIKEKQSVEISQDNTVIVK